MPETGRYRSPISERRVLSDRPIFGTVSFLQEPSCCVHDRNIQTKLHVNINLRNLDIIKFGLSQSVRQTNEWVNQKLKLKSFLLQKMLIDHLISRYLHHKSLLKGIDMAFVKKENRSMKLIPFVLALIPVIAFSKTRLEDYYVGFEISTLVDPIELDAETYDLSLNMPALESSNFQFSI